MIFGKKITMPIIAAKMAEIKGMSFEDVAKITMDNAKRFFGIQD